MTQKKRKWKIKNIVLIVMFLVLFGFLLNYGLKIGDLMKADYSFQEAVKLYHYGLYDELSSRSCSKIITKIVGEDEYIDANLNSYCEIEDIKDAKDSLHHINTLLGLGYNSSEINDIYQKKNDKLIESLEKKYVSNISNWISYDFFKVENLDRYLNYFNGDYLTSVLHVNMGLDQEFYTNQETTKEFSSTVLVNKYHPLDENFVPENLTLLDHCSSGENYLSKEAKDAYDKLCEASTEAGLHLGVTSSYRSYQDQEATVHYYLNLYGQNYVDNYVALAGYSEHQTGLALDVKSTVMSPFRNTKEYRWMLENAYKYGFILRYPKGKENLTGYNNEEWHFRYVGEKIASYLHEHDLTYDEYYAMFLDI